MGGVITKSRGVWHVVLGLDGIRSLEVEKAYADRRPTNLESANYRNEHTSIVILATTYGAAEAGSLTEGVKIRRLSLHNTLGQRLHIVRERRSAS